MQYLDIKQFRIEDASFKAFSQVKRECEGGNEKRDSFQAMWKR